MTNGKKVSDADSTETKDSVSESAETVDQSGTEEVTASEVPEVEDAEVVEEVLAEADPSDDSAPQDVQPEPAIEVIPEDPRRGGFFPLMLGGLVAGGIGYGAAYYTQPEFDTTAMDVALAEQTKTIAALRADVERLGQGPDLSAIEQAISDTGARIEDASGQIDSTAATVAGLAERLTAVELRGDEAGKVDAVAQNAYERELAQIRDQIVAQSQQMSADAQQAATRLAALEQNAEAVRVTADQVTAEAEAARTAAEQARAQAAAQQAIGKVNAAFAEGAPYQDALAPLAAMTEIPEALSAPAADGVATLTKLGEDLPGAIRSALGAARDAGESGEDSGRIGSFFKRQFQVRSTTAQDGSSVDAILSRLEANLRSGDLTGALAEADALPATARDALGPWLGLAQTRDGAVTALNDLSQKLTQE